MRSTGSNKLAAILIGGSLLLSSTAASAAAPVNPWATMSAFGTQSSRTATCAAGAAAATAVAAQGAATGCVLPVVEPAPPAMAEAAPTLTDPVAVSGGIGISPLVLALSALAVGGLIYLILNEDKPDSISPI